MESDIFSGFATLVRPDMTRMGGKLSILPGRTFPLLSQAGFAKPKTLQKQPQAHLSQWNDNNIRDHFCLCVCVLVRSGETVLWRLE